MKCTLFSMQRSKLVFDLIHALYQHHTLLIVLGIYLLLFLYLLFNSNTLKGYILRFIFYMIYVPNMHTVGILARPDKLLLNLEPFNFLFIFFN